MLWIRLHSRCNRSEAERQRRSWRGVFQTLYCMWLTWWNMLVSQTLYCHKKNFYACVSNCILLVGHLVEYVSPEIFPWENSEWDKCGEQPNTADDYLGTKVGLTEHNVWMHKFKFELNIATLMMPVKYSFSWFTRICSLSVRLGQTWASKEERHHHTKKYLKSVIISHTRLIGFKLHTNIYSCYLLLY